MPLLEFPPSRRKRDLTPGVRIRGVSLPCPLSNVAATKKSHNFISHNVSVELFLWGQFNHKPVNLISLFVLMRESYGPSLLRPTPRAQNPQHKTMNPKSFTPTPET